ncbi:MAG: DUF1254 domain-containing protein [Microlunatus sp.]|nr:DUF1254 domain-containing protein [Microlunatus sp.]
MNYLILKYAYPVTVIILAIFAWVVYQRVSSGSQLLPLAIAALVVWLLGAPAFVYFWPRITVNGYKRAILKRGLGDGPVPVNTLYAVRRTSSPAASRGSLLATGTDDVLYLGGWLDVSKGPQVLHVPDTAGRYYSLQFTDPATSANVAYIGRRTTGTAAGDYVFSAPGWNGSIPEGMTGIALPGRSALVVGRVFVASDSDIPAAYGLAKQMQLSALGQ